MKKKPIENFLITRYKKFVSQFRLVVIDEVQVRVKEKLVFESIFEELVNQEILSEEIAHIDAYGYCEIRRINNQYASITLSSVNIPDRILNKFDPSRVESLLGKIGGSLFYHFESNQMSLILTFQNKK
ncbi:MAG: hypothetical protein AAGA66_08220 [Bacteroidota bacterium]